MNTFDILATSCVTDPFHGYDRFCASVEAWTGCEAMRKYIKRAFPFGGATVCGHRASCGWALFVAVPRLIFAQSAEWIYLPYPEGLRTSPR